MAPAFVSIAPRNAALSRSDQSVGLTAAGTKRNTLLFLIVGALIVPYSAALYLGDLKLTPIKVLIISLAAPAGLQLIRGAGRKQRSLLASDACMLGVFLLMFLGPMAISGSVVFVSAFSQAIEFYGMYLIGRAYIFDDSSLRDLTRGLQIVTFVVVAFGVLDIISQRYVAHELTWLIFPTSDRDLKFYDPNLHRFVLGFSSLRAASTFDHPILFGTFCATLIPLHLYAPMGRVRRLLLVALCIVGSLTALSSAPLLALFMALAAYFYDTLLHRSPGRWRILISSIVLCVAVFSLSSDNPLSWVFRHLTLDPQTAYFRLVIWDAGLTVVSNNPWLGVGFNATGNHILDFSTDSLWLAKTMIYGIPMTTLLYLGPIAAIIPVRGQADVRKRQPLLDLMCTSLSITLATIMFVSITVTFWNAVWLFFALCIGGRVSLKERCLLARSEVRRAIKSRLGPAI